MNCIFLIISLSDPDSLVGKESPCNAGDPGLIPGLGRSTGERRGYPLQYPWLPCGSAGKESTRNAGDLGSIPGWEDPLEKGKAKLSFSLIL